MDAGTKRKADIDEGDHRDKRIKSAKKQWRVPRQNDRGGLQAKAIQPGDSGIFATCAKGREGKCVGELRDLFSEYAETLYSDALANGNKEGAGSEETAGDIESEIQAEVAGIRRPATVQLFTPVRLDVQCVVFFKTAPPVDPVSLVKKICEDAQSTTARKRTRFVKRLSPMTLMGRASAEGLEAVAKQVLAPHFHQTPFRPRKFAIRPTIRNHNILTRDSVIKQVASTVGPGHEVDLKDYDLLIVVEVYQASQTLSDTATTTDSLQNVCGVCVVDRDFEKLKRFNISEIYEPTPQTAVKEIKDVLSGEIATTAPSAAQSASSMDLS